MADDNHDRIYEELRDLKNIVRGLTDAFIKFTNEHGSLVSRLDEFRSTAKDQLTDLFAKWNHHVTEHQQDKDVYMNSINEIKETVGKLKGAEDGIYDRLRSNETNIKLNRTDINTMRQNYAGAMGTFRGLKAAVAGVIALIAALGSYVAFFK